MALASLLVAGASPVLADVLVFNPSPPSSNIDINTPVSADNSFWVGHTNPGVSVTVTLAGSVTVNDGGNSATLGVTSTSTGNSLTLEGKLDVLGATQSINVGYAGGGNTLLVQSGGIATGAGSLNVGGLAGAGSNIMTVSGSGSQVNLLDGDLVHGYGAGGNTLTVSSGGTISSKNAFIGYEPAADSNIATVTGLGSTWTNTGAFHLGFEASSNQLTLSDNGVLDVTADTLIGALPGADSNQLLVTGAGSELKNTNSTLYIGRSSNSNRLDIQNGGQVTTRNVRIGGGSNSTGNPDGNGAYVTGTDSVWDISGTLRVGSGGPALTDTNSTLEISNAGVVNVTGNSFVGYAITSDDNSILVSGADSLLNVASLVIGNVAGSTNNRVSVADAGRLSATAISIGESSGLIIGAGGAAGVVQPAVNITGALSGAFVTFNHTGTNHVFASSLIGTLAVNHNGSGSSQLTGVNSYTGPTTVNGGTLTVNSLSATSGISVLAGATFAVSAGANAVTTGNYSQDAAGRFRTHISDNTTFGRMSATGAVNVANNALIDVQVSNCAGITPGTLFAAVIASGSAIGVSSYAVSDNCPGLKFTASLSGNAQAVNLLAELDPVTAVPTLSFWGLLLMSGLLAWTALGPIRRQD